MYHILSTKEITVSRLNWRHGVFLVQWYCPIHTVQVLLFASFQVTNIKWRWHAAVKQRETYQFKAEHQTNIDQGQVDHTTKASTSKYLS
jgi:hypothetical protein